MTARAQKQKITISSTGEYNYIADMRIEQHIAAVIVALFHERKSYKYHYHLARFLL